MLLLHPSGRTQMTRREMLRQLGGAIGLAASLQVAACAPNFLIMEYMVAWEPTANAIARNPFKVENGSIALPTTPGVGIELD